MLQITIPAVEQWDELNQEFVYTKERKLQLEHSLISVSKWESKWCKPFLSRTDKTFEETIDYVRCMTLTTNVDSDIYSCLTSDNIREIKDYIDSPMTATFFSNDKRGGNSREIVTSELIYYWMISQNIPFECQKWHLNRLLTLIRVCNVKNAPPKKMSAQEIMSRNAALNEERKKRFNTKG